jgi:energy-coupling factor transporter ATP-binding protein EcfA2
VKLQQLTLENFRAFARQSFDFSARDDRDGQLILITGANEAGKSTLSQAMQFAFDGISRSEAFQQQFAPKQRPQARPAIALHFTHGNPATSYALLRDIAANGNSKLKITRARDVLQLEGEAAEAAALQVLAGERRKSSRSEALGMYRALWVQQGDVEAPRLDGAAGVTLKQALGLSLGQLSGRAELLRQQLHAERAQLIGKLGPVGELRKAQQLIMNLSTKQQQAAAALEQFEASLSEFVELSKTQALAADQQKLAQLDAQIEALMQQSAQQQTALAACKQREAELNLVQEKHRQLLAAQEKTKSQQAKLTALQTELAAQQQLIAQAKEALDAAHQARISKRALFALAQARQRYAQAENISARITEINALYAQARACKPDQSTEAITRKRNLQELQTTLQAAKDLQPSAPSGTSISIEALLMQSGWSIVQGEVRRALQSGQVGLFNLALPCELRHADGSRITLAASNTELAPEAQTKLQQLRLDIASLSHALGLNTDHAQLHIEVSRMLMEDDARQQEHAKLREHAATITRALGFSDLQTPADLQQQGEQALQTKADLMAAFPTLLQESGTTPGSAALDALQRSAENADRDAMLSSHTLEKLQAQRSNMHQQITSLQGDLDAAPAQRIAGEDLAALQIQIDSCTQQLHAARTRLDHQLSQQLAQDLARLQQERSYRAAALKARSSRLDQLRGELKALGSQELQQQNDSLQTQLSLAQQKLHSLKRRADALTLLCERMDQAKQSFEAQIQQPLLSKLQPMLQALLQEDARLSVGEDLTLSGLQRASVQFTLRELSVGTQEQLSVLTRIAYADVLHEAGQATFLIFDDVLNFSDAQRMQRLQKILSEAAKRHCILILSCKPEAWSALQPDTHIMLERATEASAS